MEGEGEMARKEEKRRGYPVGWLVGHRPEVYESRPQCGARSGPQCYLYGGIKLSEKGTSIFRVTPR